METQKLYGLSLVHWLATLASKLILTSQLCTIHRLETHIMQPDFLECTLKCAQTPVLDYYQGKMSQQCLYSPKSYLENVMKCTPFPLQQVFLVSNIPVSISADHSEQRSWRTATISLWQEWQSATLNARVSILLPSKYMTCYEVMTIWHSRHLSSSSRHLNSCWR